MSALQRGSSHNPQLAKALRLRRQAEQAQIEARRNEQARKEALRELGRKLDREAAADRREALRQGITVAELRQARELGIDLTPSKPKESLREQGKRLDQVERCYREYQPTQIHEHVTLDDLYAKGEVEWHEDSLIGVPQS